MFSSHEDIRGHRVGVVVDYAGTESALVVALSLYQIEKLLLPVSGVLPERYLPASRAGGTAAAALHPTAAVIESAGCRRRPLVRAGCHYRVATQAGGARVARVLGLSLSIHRALRLALQTCRGNKILALSS